MFLRTCSVAHLGLLVSQSVKKKSSNCHSRPHRDSATRQASDGDLESATAVFFIYIDDYSKKLFIFCIV